MNPKQKAIELVSKMNSIYGSREFHVAKQSALIAVNEMILNGNLEPQIKRHIGNVEPSIIHLEYWFQVKKEIENL